MITIKGYVVSKTLVTDPTGSKMIAIQIVEERETPGPVITGTDEASQMMRDVMPLVQQLLRSMPMVGPLMSGKVPIPRLLIWLNEDEAEALGPKLDVGDAVEIRIDNGKMELVKI
ncbi:arcadin 1 [Vulcanisaeta sp. JCM 16159]|uniref:arcadin 1 n=1 Tax=Vulcanisaeta sp. JCM 16159 TaxID=1295371 RepID=UPI0006CF337D|nr:arcadin 1 [Vulcanisaeta sp. JCM 16159]